MEPPEGEELSGPDHRVDLLLSQLWDGHLISNHQQEPAVQAGERDEDLHSAAVRGRNFPHQGDVNINPCLTVEPNTL